MITPGPDILPLIDPDTSAVKLPDNAVEVFVSSQAMSHRALAIMMLERRKFLIIVRRSFSTVVLFVFLLTIMWKKSM